MNRDEQAKRNRERMPNVAAVIDQFNEIFGPVKVHYAHDLETGVKVDRRSSHGVKKIQGR